MKLSNIFELKARDNKNIYTKIMKTQGNSPRYSDVNYTTIAKEGYMRNWIIFRCMQEIIKGAIQLNWKVKRKNADGEDEEILNHPALKVLENPNPLYGESELIKRAIAFYYIQGEAPFHRIVTSNGVKELYVYRPDRISFNSTGDIKRPYEQIRYLSGSYVDIEPENFMLWKNFNPLDDWDGLGHGMSMLEPILKNGDLLNELVNWNISLLQNGGNLSGVIALNENVTDNQFDRMEESLKNKHQGVENVGKYMLLQGVASYINTGTNPKDMDWNEGKKNTMQDICIGMGVDPILIGFNENSSYNNKNEAEKGLYTKTVIPLMRELSDQMSLFLSLDTEKGEYIDIDYSHIPVLQEDMKELYDRLSKAKDMTINEKRKAKGMDPLDGGDIIAPEGSFAIVDGKIYLPMNLIELDSVQQTAQEENKSFLY
ncbi:phage portal protein [Clostridium brassicae]|uniref:Phage portal protein n=1 Tax=Clostridium brassicae TaxID=2999072 RepID=A0ABT4D9E9_9CLOT|nr:phage portal protein [Clostridium brassicae]MCY6957861.1 phage portal protein [Clostridium brassicae]